MGKLSCRVEPFGAIARVIRTLPGFRQDERKAKPSYVACPPHRKGVGNGRGRPAIRLGGKRFALAVRPELDFKSRAARR